MKHTSDLFALLQGNAYPGRGLVLGRSFDGTRAVMVYFIMGRSENSRNRIFVPTPDGIRTQAYDLAKLTDPSLILYNPVRRFGTCTIVTNGDQTDTIREGMAAGKSFSDALRTRCFEPDAPNYTPRISGVMDSDGSYALSILKSAGPEHPICRRYFFEYEASLEGQGHLIHTYQGDGDPLPSFQGEPIPVALPDCSTDALTQQIWAALHPENRVSLFVRTTCLADGTEETHILNRHGPSHSSVTRISDSAPPTPTGLEEQEETI